MQDKWSEYWQNESATGECFVDKKGNKNPELARFWQDRLKKTPRQQNEKINILDLASGAGSIFSANSNMPASRLYALDYSAVALQKLSAKIPECRVVQASATHLPFKKGTFHKIVSQFGIEYAGVDAIVNAYHYLSDGGQLTFLSHIRDGFIDSRNAIEQAGANLCESLHFISVAKKVTQAFYAKDENRINISLTEFQAVEPLMAEYVTRHPFGVHHHLYSGFKQLFLNRQKYYLNDIIGWLEGMDQELSKTQLRMTEMRNAALEPEQIQWVTEQLSKLGAVNVSCDEFQLSDHDRPVAWLITAEKAQA